MSFYQVKQLPDLVGFFAPYFLKVQKLEYVGMCKNVMTALDSLDPKSKRFRQSQTIAKPHVLRSHKYSFEQSPRFHLARNPNERVA
jgi:hypothetical protein